MANETQRTLIIAEAGVNHNGSLDTARQLIDVAAAAGVDYVKFQTFKTEQLVSQAATKADYQVVNTGAAEETQFSMLKKLELDQPAHQELLAHCTTRGVRFLSTAFDLDSIDLLAGLQLGRWKIPSGEITNLPYLQKVASFGEPTILSTGMSSLAEVGAALKVLLAHGLSKEDITVLHCNTEYPTPMQDVHLRAMQTMADTFGVAVGYSDHTLGIEVPMAAVALGAVCIEKHFTLDRSMPGPDHQASLEPAELIAMVEGIRKIELALGRPVKTPSPSEQKNLAIARKSIHLTSALPAGHLLARTDLVMKRPGDGISPMEIESIIGCSLRKALPAETKLKRSDLV